MKAVSQGRITEQEIDVRVDELLDVMLSTRKAVDPLKGKGFDKEAHHAFAQRASEESIVLLKNEGNILPLKKGASVAVIGEFAKKARYQGAGSSVVNCTKLDHTMDVIGRTLYCFISGLTRSANPRGSTVRRWRFRSVRPNCWVRSPRRIRT